VWRCRGRRNYRIRCSAGRKRCWITKVEVAVRRGFDSLGVYDVFRLESAGDIGLAFVRGHGVIEHIEQRAVLRLKVSYAYDGY